MVHSECKTGLTQRTRGPEKPHAFLWSSGPLGETKLLSRRLRGAVANDAAVERLPLAAVAAHHPVQLIELRARHGDRGAAHQPGHALGVVGGGERAAVAVHPLR